MSAKIHHEIHPDAEMLSAFAEQALNEKERGGVLKHLAVCGRCRQVVALARESAGAELAARRRGVVRPRTWWRSSAFALAPAAAVAATAVIAIYVHERRVEKTAEVAKVEQQQAIEKAPLLPQASPQPPAYAASPESSRGVPEKTKKVERPERAERPEMAERPAPVAEPGETAAAPPPEVMNGLLSSHEGPAEAPGFERHGTTYAPTGAALGDRTPSDAAVFDMEREKRAEEQKEDRHLFAAAEAESPRQRDSGTGAAESGAAENNEPAGLSAGQLETKPAPAAGYLQLQGLHSMADVTNRPYALHLPSRLLAISIASADHRMLAIDEKGALFLSEDSGGTWEKVKRQWTGRAMAVRRRAEGSDTGAAAPAPETAENAPASGAASQPATVFELLNDQSQAWISVDGRIWKAK